MTNQPESTTKQQVLIVSQNYDELVAAAKLVYPWYFSVYQAYEGGLLSTLQLRYQSYTLSSWFKHGEVWEEHQFTIFDECIAKVSPWTKGWNC